MSLRELINLHIVVINPVSNRKLPASTREPNRRFPIQLCISMWTIPSYTGGTPQISTSFRIFNDTLRRYNNFDDEAQTLDCDDEAQTVLPYRACPHKINDV